MTNNCVSVCRRRRWLPGCGHSQEVEEWQIDGRANRLDGFNGKIKERVDSSFPSDFSGLAN